MTIQDLIDSLSKFDPDLTVSVFGCDGDYDDPVPTYMMKSGRIDRIVLVASKDD